MTSLLGNTSREENLTAAEFGIDTGAEVTSADAKKLGTVSDLRGPYFRLHRGLLAGSDCWLDVGDVVAVMEEQVILDFVKKDLSGHRVLDNIVRDDRTDARADHLLDGAQMDKQRERMEKELERRR
jgi:hypothetical protein